MTEGNIFEIQKNLRIYAVCGIVAPILFWVIATIDGILRPGYNPLYNYVSDLGVGPLSIIQNINFIIFGILTLIFGYGLRMGFPTPHTRSLTAGIIFFLIFSIGVLLAGVFPEDYLSQGPHNIVSATAFVASIVAQLLIWQGLRSKYDEVWAKYRTYTLISGLLSLLLVVLLKVAMLYGFYPGLVQRAFLIVPWLWVFVTGLKIYSLTEK